jgi:hypothetical protein
LKTRLERLATVLDLSVVYLNIEVAQLKDGAPFGELALKSSEDRRAASISIKEETFLAYLDRTDYNMVMKRVMRAKTQRQLQILRSHKLFTPVS